MNKNSILLAFVLLSLSLKGYNRIDSFKWAIEYGKNFPNYFFFHQDREDQIVSNTMFQNSGHFFSISRAISNRVYLSVGYQRIYRNFHQNYTKRYYTDYYKREHKSYGSFMHLTAAYMILKRNYLNIYFQCGAGISSISDQILSKYSDSTTLKLYPGAQNHEYYRSVFFSGLAGFKMETNIYKKRLFFDLQVNYIRESVRRNYYTNSSNRITFDIGLIWKFKLKRWQ